MKKRLDPKHTYSEVSPLEFTGIHFQGDVHRLSGSLVIRRAHSRARVRMCAQRSVTFQREKSKRFVYV